MTKLRLAWFIIFLIFTVALLGAAVYSIVVIVKAKNDELTEETTAILNADPAYKEGDSAYMLSLEGEGDRYKVYKDAVLEVEIFNTLKKGSTITYCTYKNNDISKLTRLGDVTMVTYLKIDGKEVMTFGSYYDAMYADYSWMMWMFCSLTVFCAGMASTMFTLYRKARREQAIDHILRRFH